MTKYWNVNRIRRVRKRKIQAQRHVVEREVARKDSMRTYSRGNTQKNSQLMLDALGLLVRRRMVALLVRDGAMSVSKIAKPFHLTLPSALAHVRQLERSGIITTHKRGRVRMCVYNRLSSKELATWLLAGGLQYIK